MAQPEILIRVNSDDEPIESVEKVTAHQGAGVLHRAFTVFLRNEDGKWLITQRSHQKPLWPEWWDAACSSHPWWPNESSEAATLRRIPLELGITVDSVRFLFKYEYHAVYSPEWAENEVNHILLGQFSGEPNPNPDEVADWKWMSSAEITTALADPHHRFAPWFPLAWERLSH